MAQGARDQGNEEYTSHLESDQPISSARRAFSEPYGHVSAYLRQLDREHNQKRDRQGGIHAAIGSDA